MVMAEFLNLLMVLLKYLSMSFSLYSNGIVLFTLWALSQRKNKPLRKLDKAYFELSNNPQIIDILNFYVHQMGKKS